jgi:biotin operon repressor
MNTPEFRLLDIWQKVVELKKVRWKMLAYRKIASQVGISERNVRENIKKLVELGYLVEKDNWYAMNFDCEFIQFVIEEHTHKADTVAESAEEPICAYDVSIRFQVVYQPPQPYYEVVLSDKTLHKLTQDFGYESTEAIIFLKEKILQNR